MKKFLSILLALAVGFTFTFGSAMSAFAATTDDKDVYLASVDSAKATALEALNAQYEVAKAQVKAKDTATPDKINGYDVYSEAWLAALDLLYKDIKTAVETKASKLKSVSATGTPATWTEVVYTDITTSNEVVTPITGGTDITLDDVDDAAGMINTITTVEKYMFVAAKAQFATDKAKYLAAAATIDTAIYSTTEDSANPYKLAVTKSYTNAKAYAEALVADLVSMLNTNTYVNLETTDADSTKVTDKAKAMKALFDDVVAYNPTTKVYSINETVASYSVYAGANYNSEYATAKGDNKRYNILSLTEEKVSDQNKAYAIQAAINTNYNYIYNGQDSTGTPESSITSANADAIAAWQPLADAYKVVAEYTGTTAFPAWKVTYTKAKGYVLTETGSTYYIDNVKAVEDTKALVENLKTTGKYDEKALDSALKSFTDTTYTAMNTKAVALSTSSIAIEACLKASLTDFNKETAKYELSQHVADSANASGLYVLGVTPAYNAKTFTVANKNYYAKEWEEIKAAAEAYYKAVDAAVDPSDITAAKKAFNNAAYAVKGSSEVVFDTAFNNAVAYAFADVTAYITLINAGKTAENQIDASDYDTQAEVSDWFKVNGARTANDVTAMTATLKAEIAALPTKGQLDAKKEAVEKLIAELPGTLVLTFADKAKVVAAYDAYVEAKEYGVSTISNDGTLKAVITKMNELEAKEVEKAYKTIKHGVLATVTIADKTDVLAAKEICDAYVKGYETKASDGADGMYTYATSVKDTTYTTLLGSKCLVGSLYNAIRTLEAKTLVGDIADANENTPAADVKALKEKYTAFVAEYACVECGYDAAAAIINADKLDTLIAATKWTDADVKAYVFDQATKATSVKLSAKKVKVTANFDASKLVENGYTVEYKFYKSTKKSSGYKYAVTKSADNATYTNTNAKKGKNYYKFKVVVKNADGTVILTTALKDCKYACRTIK